MRPLLVSYGDICILTRSPIVRRMNRLRIFPEMCARTRCSFASATRNIVPGSTLMIVPSKLMAFVPFIMMILRSARPRMLSGPAVQSIPDLPAIARKTVRAVRARPVFPWTSFVHVERAAVKFVAVKPVLRRIGLSVVVHSDKRKPARFTGHLVHHQMDFVDGSMFFEQILKIVLGGLKREITYVQFHCVLNMEILPSYRAVPVNRVSNHQ